MTKTLLLMRHGKSSWKDKKIPDYERPLKKRGKAASAEIGKILRENELIPQAILSSPALRASETAEIVAKESGFPGKITFIDSFYMAEPDVYINYLKGLDDSLERVMIISHNPGLEAFMQLLDGRLEALPTGSMAYLCLNINHWSDLSLETDAELIGFWDPETELEHKKEALAKREQEMAKDKKNKKEKDKKDKKEKKQKKDKKDKK
ncbi:MAG TPA: histidine phosphatase family protein [Anaerolineaceae bacterium]|nr:histidine phosphatase family protein [Anaerolineaceae bacterium]